MTPRIEIIATRSSLIKRLKNWDDRASWKDFFDTYWKLIYGVARAAGLNDAEAQDVVQETIICVAKKIAQRLGAKLPEVYFAKYKVAALVKKEYKALEEKMT